MSQEKKRIAVVVSAIISFVGISCLPLIFFESPKSWQDFAALSTYVYTIATVLILVVIAATGFFAYRQLPILQQQLRENTRTRQLALLPRLIDSNDKTRAARRRVTEAYCEHSEWFASVEAVNDFVRGDLEKDCAEVLYGMADFGTFIKHSLIEEDFAKDWLNIIPVMTWVILKHYITLQQRKRTYRYWGVPIQFLAFKGIEHWLEVQKKQPEGLGESELVIASCDLHRHAKTVEELKRIREELKKNLRDLAWWPEKFPIIT